MSGIMTLYERKVSLLDLFQSGQVSERVFLRLYNEYSGKLNDFLNARASKLGELRTSMDEQDGRLSDLAVQLEELEVRSKLGEMDVNVYNQKAEVLRSEERRLMDSVKMLKVNIDCLENLLADKRPSEIRDLEATMVSYRGALERLIDEGKIAEETFKKIERDIDETLKFFDSLIMGRKERDRKLREQLETLQTRYKLSELSIEEYERRKRELQAEIDKIWA